MDLIQGIAQYYVASCSSAPTSNLGKPRAEAHFNIERSIATELQLSLHFVLKQLSYSNLYLLCTFLSKSLLLFTSCSSLLNLWLCRAELRPTLAARTHTKMSKKTLAQRCTATKARRTRRTQRLKTTSFHDAHIHCENAGTVLHIQTFKLSRACHAKCTCGLTSSFSQL